jgi:hypothetical protein
MNILLKYLEIKFHGLISYIIHLIWVYDDRIK